MNLFALGHKNYKLSVSASSFQISNKWYVPVAAHDHRCLVGAGRVVVLDVVVQQQAVVGASSL